MPLIESIMAALLVGLKAYEQALIVPLLTPVDPPLQVRRKYLIGAMSIPFSTVAFIALIVNAAYIGSPGQCLRSALYAVGLQSICGGVLLGVYIVMRISKEANDAGIIMFCVAILVDVVLTAFQLPPRVFPLLSLFLVLPVLIMLVAGSSFFQCQRMHWFYWFILAWFGLQTYSVYTSIFEDSPHSVLLECGAPFAVEVVIPCATLAFFAIFSALSPIGHYLLESAAKSVERTNATLGQVTEKLAQCDTAGARTSIEEHQHQLPDEVRMRLLKLVDYIALCGRYIQPTMQAQLRAEVQNVPDSVAPAESSVPVAEQRRQNPLEMQESRADSEASISTPRTLAQPVNHYDGALLSVSHPGGCIDQFRSLVDILTRHEGEILSVSLTEIVAAWPLHKPMSFLDDSDSSSSLSGNEARTTQVLYQAEDAARQILDAFPIPQLRVALTLGAAWGMTLGTTGQQRTFTLGGSDLERLSSLAVLASVIGVRAIVTHKAAAVLHDRCYPIDLIQFGLDTPCEAVHILIPGLARKEYGNRETRLRAMVLRTIIDDVIRDGPLKAPQHAIRLQTAADGDQRVMELCCRIQEAAAAGTPKSWSRLFRRPAAYVLDNPSADADESPSCSTQSALLDVEVSTSYAELGEDSRESARARQRPENAGSRRVSSARWVAASPLSLADHTILPTAEGGSEGLNNSSTSSSAASIETSLKIWRSSRSSKQTGLVEMFLDDNRSDGSDGEREQEGEGGSGNGVAGEDDSAGAVDAPTDVMPRLIIDTAGNEWRRSNVMIGSGAFSAVFSAVGEFGQPVVLKCIDLTNRKISAMASEVVKEVATMQALRHRNIVGYISHAVVESHVVLVLECAAGGSLHGMLKMFGTLPIGAVRRYMRDALLGLRYLHDNNVTHCDIKPHNLLLSSTGNCKLADFGSAVNASVLESGEGSPTDQHLSDQIVNGTPLYMAPEACRSESGKPCDIWSIGMTALELLTGQLQWSNELASLNPIRFVRQMANDETLMPIVDATLPPEAQSFLSACLQRDPTKRPNAHELLMHPFLKRADADLSLTSSSNF